MPGLVGHDERRYCIGALGDAVDPMDAAAVRVELGELINRRDAKDFFMPPFGPFARSAIDKQRPSCAAGGTSQVAEDALWEGPSVDDISGAALKDDAAVIENERDPMGEWVLVTQSTHPCQ
ncbi:MAG: hypothetical protein V7607_5140 [Solirubrobacteraceae bacterium]